MMELRIRRKKLASVLYMILILVHKSIELNIPREAFEAVQSSFLSKLGLRNRPMVDRSKVHIPQAMVEMYERQINGEYESTALPLPGRLTRSANTVRSYTHQESEIDDKFVHGHKFRLYFDISDYPINETLISAELRLTKVPKRAQNGNTTTSETEDATTEAAAVRQRCNAVYVRVYDIVRPGVIGKYEPVVRLIVTKYVTDNTVDDDEEKTVSIDVLPVVDRWLSDYQNDNHGILVTVRSPAGGRCTSNVRLKRSIATEHRRRRKRSVDKEQKALDDDDGDDWNNVQPLLFLYTKDDSISGNRRDTRSRLSPRTTATAATNASSRKRRSTGPLKSKKRTRSECRRLPLVVKFSEVGWDDWIIAPPEYPAFYCAGECPSQFGDHLNATNHAIIQSLAHSLHPDKIDKPCCVPTTLGPISMLYLNENNATVMKNYDDMVVEGCGCR